MRKVYLFLVCVMALSLVKAQDGGDRMGNLVDTRFFDRLFEARYMDKPPVFTFGADSLRRFYFRNFPAFDTVLAQTVNRGDTAMYIRVCFSFTVDRNGFVGQPEFDRVAITRNPKAEQARTLKYFNSQKDYFDKAIKQLFLKMPQWRPGLQSNRPVDARVEDYLQIWVGINPPSGT